jgi:hypothetical protein
LLIRELLCVADGRWNPPVKLEKGLSQGP